MTKVSFFLINDKQGGVCSHTLLCDYHELLEDLLHFFFQPVHMPVNRLFGNLQIPGYFMSAIPLDLHQNDLKGKPVHGDQHMLQFLIFNTIQEVLYCFWFCLICGCCNSIKVCTCFLHTLIIASDLFENSDWKGRRTAADTGRRLVLFSDKYRQTKNRKGC